MNYGVLYGVVYILCWTACITAQLIPPLSSSRQSTQNSANDLLQQTLMSNLRNQASLLSNMGMSRNSNPALDMLMSGLDAQRQGTSSTSAPTGRSLWDNMVPVDQLLQQQQTLHSSLLQDILNTGLRTQSSAQSGTDSSTSGTNVSPGPFDNVRVVVFNGPGPSVGSASGPRPIPTVQSGFSSSFSSGPTSHHFFENIISGFRSDSSPAIVNVRRNSRSGRGPIPPLDSPKTPNSPNVDWITQRAPVSRNPPSVALTQPQTPPPLTQPPPTQPPTTQLPLTQPPPPPQNQKPAVRCSGEYRKIPGHTLCMDDSPGVTHSGVSMADRMLITQFHNELRSNVQPPAADLLKLHWDNRLAAVAEKWAKQCKLAHDKERSIPELGLSVGQNVAVGYDNWQIAIQEWYDEIRKYRYGVEPDSYLGPEGWREIAHFTQIVQNGSYLIGCGYAECPYTEYIRFYVCNYAAGQSNLAYPYTAGTRCGSCPNNCVNGLCDCGNLVCRNKGKLDPNTCTCDCPRPYKGKTCEIVDCPAQDKWICGRDWPRSYCDRFFNVPEECPHMCGLCGGTQGSPSIKTVPEKAIILNTTFTSNFGCKYTGKRDSQQSCKQYGDKGADMRMCASEGGNVGCSECDRYFNIKKDYCPVMCGLCDPPCNGKKCLNGGTLETGTCTCQCRPPFTGDICQLAQCPVNGDPRFCRYWPRKYCDLYHNVPEECPFKCGICTDRSENSSAGGGGGEA